MKNYSTTKKIFEVKELTDENISDKFLNKLIDEFSKNPGKSPSRDITHHFYTNKPSVTYSEILQSSKGETYANILIHILDNFYKWPSNSKSYEVMITFINNELDLNNIDSKVVLSRAPGFIIGGLKYGGGLLGFLAGAVAQDAVDYTLYGSDSAMSGAFLPQWKGFFEDPLLASYASIFNMFSIIIFNAWDYIMGIDDYSKDLPNLIKSYSKVDWFNEYINKFFQDDDLKIAFTNFISKLKDACNQDRIARGKIFNTCPFYYVASITIVWNDGKQSIVSYSELQHLIEKYKNTHTFSKKEEGLYIATWNGAKEANTEIYSNNEKGDSLESPNNQSDIDEIEKMFSIIDL